MEGFTNKLIDILLAIVIFVALLGVIVTSLNGFTWSAVNIGGTVYNMAWAPYIVVILLVVGLVYLTYKYLFSKHK